MAKKNNGFRKWFNDQGLLVRLVLLFIPFVNWFCEIMARWEKFLNEGGIINLILAVIVLFGGGLVFGWIDFFWVLLFGHFFLCK